MLLPAVAAADAPVTLDVLSPAANLNFNGTVALRFKVNNLSPNGYLPFWAVDNGEWNHMTQDATDPTVAEATVDVSGWNWQKNHQYTLSFIALQKSNWQPVTQNVPITVGLATPTVSGANPGLSAQMANHAQTNLYTDPRNQAATQSASWIAGHPGDASALNYLASAPTAQWFGNWNGNVQSDVNDYVSRATAAHALPSLVAYNIPNRDCNGYSSGGAGDANAYNQWISSFAQGIGRRAAIVILEPDALAGMNCLSAGDQDSRTAMLKNAVQTIQQQTDASVYIDAGHPDWQTPATMAKRLNAAGIAGADGFSLNVSNFMGTSDNIAYGTQLSKLLNNAHFVIDTSRNGNGSSTNGQWCNPSGRTTGQFPTLNTGNPLVDAYLWIKTPGASDGNCGAQVNGSSAPQAGAWWPQYAVGLVQQ